MKRLLAVSIFLLGLSSLGLAEILRDYGPASPTLLFQEFAQETLGNWPKAGPAFIKLSQAFRGYLVLVALVPAGIFLLHYLVFGPKRFAPSRFEIPYYGAFTRLCHWLAALTFSFLCLSGFAILFAKNLKAGALVRNLRYLHLLSGFGFFGAVVPLFLIWWREMLPAPYDLSWFLSLGGYLSRRQKPVPAGKFNAGQKLWFWTASIGGTVMFLTGFYLYRFEGPVDLLRNFLIIHNVLALILVALFVTHLYMVLFAVKGALKSMITGQKPEEEVKVLHPKFYEKLVIRS